MLKIAPSAADATPMAFGRWQDANSRVIAAFRYDEAKQVLQIRSRRSGRTHSFECSGARYAAFLNARSMGRFIAVLRPTRRPGRWRLLPR